MFNWLDNNLSISIENDPVRNQATCIFRHGDTYLMCIGKVGSWCDSGDFSRLTVDYFERSYAINKIPGGFVKRESRQKENEVLISRLIDRAIRPTIASGFKFEINLSCFILSYSRECSAEALSITACSAVLQALGVPSTMVVGIKLFHSDKWNTTYSRVKSTAIISGNNYGISSFEFNGTELPANSISEATDVAIPKINQLLEKIYNLTSELQKPEYAPPISEKNPSIIDANLLLQNYRKNNFEELSRQKSQFLSSWNNQKLGEAYWNDCVREVLRQSLFWANKRLDGRSFDDARKMNFETPFLKKLHGSSFFSKGRTKCICAVTIGGTNDTQLYEALEGNENRKFILNYNFLAGDDRITGSTSRRELGHGNLARNALKSFISDERFIRVVSEVISSDGSSSMGTVCAAWLALRNADINISEVVAGISVGLISKDFINKFIVDLTQIEDFLSDMDLKAAGTSKGFTTIQMDLKIPYLPWDVFKKSISYSFTQLKDVIQKIQDVIPAPSKQKSPQIQVAHTLNQNRENKNHIENKNKDDENFNNFKKKIEENLNKPKESNTKEESRPKEKQEKDRSEGFSIKLPLENVSIIQQQLEKLRSETQSSIYIKNDRINVYSKELGSTISKILSIGYQSQKELNYAKIEKISGNTVGFVLIGGRKGSFTPNEDLEKFKEGISIVVYRGRKWTLFAILP